jgi:hypothetical protein
MTEIDKRDGDKSMGKVVWHAMMSLDGFITGPDDTVDRIFDYDTGPNSVSEETIKTTVAILVGRRWYALAVSRLATAPRVGG